MIVLIWVLERSWQSSCVLSTSAAKTVTKTSQLWQECWHSLLSFAFKHPCIPVLRCCAVLCDFSLTLQCFSSPLFLNNYMLFFWPASIFHSPIFFLFFFFWLCRCSTSACFLHWPCCPLHPPPIVPLLLSCATPAVLFALLVMCLSMSVANKSWIR